jgi:hypothetical protein
MPITITPYAYTLSHIDENGVTGAVLAIFNEFVDYLNTLSNSEIRGSTCKQYVFSMLGAILAALPPPIRTTLKLKLKLTSASDPPVGLTTDSLKVALVETVKEIFKTNDIEVIALLGAKPDSDKPDAKADAKVEAEPEKKPEAKTPSAKPHVPKAASADVPKEPAKAAAAAEAADVKERLPWQKALVGKCYNCEQEGHTQTDCPATFCGAEKKFKKCKRGAKCNFAKHHVS